MSKMIAFFASLLLIPSLALGYNSCPTLSDQQYVDFLTAKPFIYPITDEDDILGINFTGTAKLTFRKNYTVTEHVNFRSDIGNGTIDLNANWSVHSAVLSVHITSAKHSDTRNKTLNQFLDAMVEELKANPDMNIPLNDCDNFKRSLKGYSLIMRK